MFSLRMLLHIISLALALELSAHDLPPITSALLPESATSSQDCRVPNAGRRANFVALQFLCKTGDILWASSRAIVDINLLAYESARQAKLKARVEAAALSGIGSVSHDRPCIHSARDGAYAGIFSTRAALDSISCQLDSFKDT